MYDLENIFVKVSNSFVSRCWPSSWEIAEAFKVIPAKRNSNPIFEAIFDFRFVLEEETEGATTKYVHTRGDLFSFVLNPKTSCRPQGKMIGAKLF